MKRHLRPLEIVFVKREDGEPLGTSTTPELDEAGRVLFGDLATARSPEEVSEKLTAVAILHDPAITGVLTSALAHAANYMLLPKAIYERAGT